MLRPIKVLFCHSNTTYVASLSNLYNLPANLSEELKEALLKETPQIFDFHGTTNYQEALMMLVKANLEGSPTDGYYPDIPFDIFACEVSPSSSGNSSNLGLDVLDQVNNKLDLGAACLYEQRDPKQTLKKRLYRPGLCTIALVKDEHKSWDFAQNLMSCRVFHTLPFHMSSEELQIELQRCYHLAFTGGLEQIRVAADFIKGDKGNITNIRLNLRWKSEDENQKISNRSLLLDQVTKEDLDAQGINLDDYRGRLKDLFTEIPKFRELSIKALRSRYSKRYGHKTIKTKKNE